MPLQKSFSDTNHSSKRQPWKRNRSYQGQQPSKTGPSMKPLQEKPPLPVSTSTKNKLAVFEFRGQSENDKPTNPAVISLLSSDEKENGSPIETELQPKQNDTKSLSDLLTAEESSTSFPSTPAGRLALPDLIEMGDVKREVQGVSPEDRIEWDQRSSASPFGIRRAKKRARSSSPASSPAAKASDHLNSRGEPLDPGSELWGRYSFGNSNMHTPQGALIPALANIMFTSSPQPSRNGTPRPGSTLRRTNSCGTSFPKRRRIGGPESADVITESVNIGPSKLSVLIQTVQRGFTPSKPPVVEANPHKCSRDQEKSPSCKKYQAPIHKLQMDQGPSQQVARIQTLNKPELTETSLSARSHASDYGEFDDEDLDASLLDAFVRPDVPFFNASEESTSGSAYETSLGRGANTQLVPLHPLVRNSKYPKRRIPSPIKPKVMQLPSAKPEGDEFDDSDEDLFAAGLDDMVACFSKKEENKAGSPAPKLALNTRSPQKRMRVVADSDDEFGDNELDDNDFEVAEKTATQAIQQSSHSLLPSTQKNAIQRYLVTNVLESEYETSNGHMLREKILFLQIEKTNITRTVNLRGTWFETPVTVKAFVHILGVFESSGRCIIDDTNHMIILHPDHLISTTVVGDSFGCIRRAVLQDRVKATSEASKPMLYGTLLHEIFQAAMLANCWDTKWLNDLIEAITKRHLEDLYTIKLGIPEAIEHLQSKMPELQSWAELFVSSQPQPGALVKAGNGINANMCVSKLLDVEEHVWSPMYGLKGNIDATVQVTMKDQVKESKSRTLTVPFEVKTGKNPSAAHRAQTALYNLLLSDRYDVEIAYGILYYMETSETIRIPAIRHELRHMIMQRNELACFVRERHAQLPPMLKKENLCNRCYAKTTCFIYHKLADDGNGETSGVKDKFDTVVKHLTPRHKEFFLKWDDLLTKEERESMKFRRELWTMLSSEREMHGRCFSNVIIEPDSAYEDKGNSKINRYRYTLVKKSAPSGFSFLHSQINLEEPIVISDEKGHFALAKGFVTNIRKTQITVAVDRRLHNARIRQPGFDEVDNQVFASIMEIAPEGATAEESTGKIVEEPVLYRLDKDEFSNGMATVRNNLIQVMADGLVGAREIRSLVVDLVAPRFKTQATAYTLTDRENINMDQQRAIQKVMSAEDYALVLGMPGTGKTTTIAHIIRALVSQGKSVLLTSYTHSAVDNILLKLKNDNIPILRLGNISKIHKEVQEFATLAAMTKTSFEDIRSAWHDTPIVGTTCLGINHPVFNERTFDYCIVDEASQITLPVCIGPIRLARTFILVGDHNQLPPLVQNEEARAGGLDISLFKHLSDSHPSSVVYLEHQYRMCADVMALSNNLIYNGRLKCGSQAVADRRLAIPNIDALKLHHHTPSTLAHAPTNTICPNPERNTCWLGDLLNPATTVAFINTDPLLPGAREEAKGNRIVNPTEAVVCKQLIEGLLTIGVPATDIGVMTHYRSQLSLLKDSLRKHPDVEMHTADRFQGRDKEVIVLSLVRSNDVHSIGELLKDWRRINVAFTRAKTKLLVVGSRDTLKGGTEGGDEMVAKFVALMEEKGWIYDLPAGALDSHVWDESVTQTQGTNGIPTQVAVEWVKIKREKVAMKMENKENPPQNPKVVTDGAMKGKRKGLGIGHINGAMRQPAKKICGQKPFKIPRQSILTDIFNEEAL